MTNLLQQQITFSDGELYHPNLLFDQRTMVACCLPILLLQVPSQADRVTKAAIINHNCQRFLQGNWRSLAATRQQ
jgi:hypothetical protein